MPDSIAKKTCVGLDVSKAQLDYDGPEFAGKVANTTAGHAQLLSLLQALPNPQVICEDSGGYQRAVVAFLLQAEIEVCVVMPSRARAFAHSLGRLAKTDRIDARLLRQFGETGKLRPKVRLAPEVEDLRALAQRRDDLVGRLVELKNQQQLARPGVARSLRDEQEFLEQQQVKIEQQILALIRAHPQLKQNFARLLEVSGVGEVTAYILLSHLPELGRVSDRAIAAIAGVAPHPRDSGTTLRPRFVRGGRTRVRTACYMAALAAIRSNPILRAFYQRLRNKNKPAKLALIAVVRKLLCLLNRLLAQPDFSLAR